MADVDDRNSRNDVMADFNEENASLTPYCTFAVKVENSENFH